MRPSFTIRDNQVEISHRVSKTGHYRGGYKTRKAISNASWKRLYAIFCAGRSSFGGGWYSFNY